MGLEALMAIPGYLAAAIVLASSASFAGSEHVIQWKERDNRIIHDSVCFNHPHGSIVYRRCKANAKTHFQEKCAEYREKFKSLPYPKRLEYRGLKDKFCYAARNYKII